MTGMGGVSPCFRESGVHSRHCSNFSLKEWKLLRTNEVHGRPEGTAKRNFDANREHFIENEDYFIVKPSDFEKYEIRTFGISNRGTTLLTESGYLMLVKSFDD